MKKILYLVALMVTMSFISCGDKIGANLGAADSVDTTAVDTVLVDTVLADSVK